jgi:predicted Holliday junction resolvase-like endonuclease
MTTATTLIAEIQRDKRFKATCPVCMEDFALADAVVFALGSEPPAAALAALKAMRARIRERKQALRASRERMTKGARRTAEAVNLGMIVEKIVPSFPSFAYEAGDCRAMFEPIDYLIFSGLAKPNRVGALYFVDVKSGNARPSAPQQSIKKAVESGAVKFGITQKRFFNMREIIHTRFGSGVSWLSSQIRECACRDASSRTW